MMEKHLNKIDLEGAVRRVLLFTWDPIGVRELAKVNFKAVHDEYDKHVKGLVRLIQQQASKEEVESFLYIAEGEQVPSRRNKLPSWPSKERTEAAIELILALQVRAG